MIELRKGPALGGEWPEATEGEFRLAHWKGGWWGLVVKLQNGWENPCGWIPTDRIDYWLPIADLDAAAREMEQER